MKINDIIKIKIEDLSDNGKGIGFININGKKYSVFVPLTVKDDLVKCKINSIKKLYIEADLIEIVKKSKYRIKPICKHFNECGACDLLHINYEEQINSKKRILLRYLQRNNLNYENFEIIQSEKKLFYRDRSKFFKFNDVLGFKKRKSNKIVKIEKCYIINEKLNEIFSKKLLKKDEIHYGFCYKRKQISTAKCVYYYNNFEFFYRPDLFIQSNLTMNSVLIDIVYNESKGKTLLDLYSGNGNFSIPLSKKFNKIVSIEGDEKSFDLLEKNIKLNKINNIEAYNDDVSLIELNEKFDTIVLDPPRTGIEDISFIENFCDNIIYVSCNAKKTVKEIKLLKNFILEKVYLIDMFPQTVHFESVFVLRKNDN